MVIADQSQSPESRELAETFGSSGYFRVRFLASPEEAMSELHREGAKVALIIPPDFGGKTSDARAEVQLLTDGADNMSLNAVMGYAAAVCERATARILRDRPRESFIRTRLLFNPELNSKWFIIPGLSAMIIALVSILLTSLTICREYEQGSMELLLSAPLKSSEIILGKITPYAFLSWCGFGVVYAAARILYEVPFRGSHLILLPGTAIFILDYLALGLLISIIAKQQQLAVQMAMIIGLLPTLLLSGFVFPIEYMPKVMQYITVIFPARWYIDIARCEFLRGSSFTDLATPFSALFLQGIVITAVAVGKLRGMRE
jgi:ABC-2 type transport system permease protein